MCNYNHLKTAFLEPKEAVKQGFRNRLLGLEDWLLCIQTVALEKKKILKLLCLIKSIKLLRIILLTSSNCMKINDLVLELADLAKNKVEQ